MDIKNSREIIAEFIERYNFSHIFTDKSLPLGDFQSDLRFNNSEAVDFLISAAITGKKSIGFFKQLPLVNIKRPLRGECVFVCRFLPMRIDMPVIFCRKAEELSNILILSLKVSSESKLPVSVVVSDNAANNYAKEVKISRDLIRTSPYLHANTFKMSLDGDDFNRCVAIAESIFKTSFNPVDFESGELSFKNSDMPFFSYLLPNVLPEFVKNISGKTFTAPKSEAQIIENMLKSTYGISVTVNGTVEEAAPKVKDFLCPGCPFVSIITKIKDKNIIIFTDIECEGVLKTFNLNTAGIEEYMGLLSENLNAKTLFIGSVSQYKPSYDRFLKDGKVIFLNDCGLNSLGKYPVIRHPKKTNPDKNVLFPYSCSNIKSYMRAKINAKKCRCIKDGTGPQCIETVKCPAIYTKNDVVVIDSNACTGCFACKTACPFGAVK